MVETLSYLQFAQKHGLVTDYDVQGHIHGGLRAAHMPASYHRWYAKRLNELQHARAEGMRLFAAAIEAGEVEKPAEASALERLIAKADGHPDLPSVQAANRVLSKAMLKALRNAASRERGNICPIAGVHANAEVMLLKAIEKRGFIEWDGDPWKSAPRVNDAGRTAAKATA